MNSEYFIQVQNNFVIILCENVLKALHITNLFEKTIV